MAGKKEAKQRAGPSGRKEKCRRETGEPLGVKDSLEDAGRKSAQETQKKEAHKDLKDQGEVKKPSVTKRRQVRKVATMVKRLRKSPEDGESQTPTEGDVVSTARDGWDAQQQATGQRTPSLEGCSPERCCRPLSTQWKRPCAKKRKVIQLVRFPLPA